MAKGDALFGAFNVKGHYRTSVFITLPATLAANARLFSIRNTGTNLLIPTRMTMRAVQAAAGTAQLANIAAFRCTNFTASDNTNTAALTASVMSTRGDMAASPGNAELFVATAAAGMTGGTLTKDTAFFSALPINVAATANSYLWQCEALDISQPGTHPFVLARNEGIEVENTFLNVTSYGVTLVIDFAWAEAVSFAQ